MSKLPIRASTLCHQCLLRLHPSRRTFTSSSYKLTSAVPSFHPTTSPDLDSLLTKIRSTIFLPTALTPSQRRLVYEQKNIPLLTSDIPATVKLGPETHTLHPLNRQKDEPSTERAFHSSVQLMREANEWSNVVPLLEGLKKARRNINADMRAKLVRVLCENGQLGAVLALLRGAERTGVSMAGWKVLKEVLGGVVVRLTTPLTEGEMATTPNAKKEEMSETVPNTSAELAGEGVRVREPSQEGGEGNDEYTIRIKRAVSYAENIADLLWQRAHQPRRTVPHSHHSNTSPPSPNPASRAPLDPRTRPDVLGHLLLAHSLLGPSNVAAVDSYARAIVGNWSRKDLKPADAWVGEKAERAEQPSADGTNAIDTITTTISEGTTASSSSEGSTNADGPSLIKATHAANQALITWAPVLRGIELATALLGERGGRESNTVVKDMQGIEEEVKGWVERWVGEMEGWDARGFKREDGQGRKGMLVLEGVRALKGVE